MDKKTALSIAIGLSAPSKMPCSGYSLPAARCHVGSKLRTVPGSVCFGCYAFKGNYTFANVQSALERRFVAIEDDRWVDAMIVLIRETAIGDRRFFRWHDSGDLQSAAHLAKIVAIAEALPDISFWLPTKEFALVRDYFKARPVPANLTVRLSQPRIDQAAPARDATSPFQYSEVHGKTGQASAAAYPCPAKSQGNKCLDCRACWNKANWATSYPAH